MDRQLNRKSDPLASVVIPAYNHECYVEQSIRSVLGQSYRNIELVVVDDGSTDNTWERIQRVRLATDGAFRAFRKPNGGVSSALNYGITRSSGDFIGVLASDDYFLPRKIELQMEEFKRLGDDVAVVHTGSFGDYGDDQLVSETAHYRPARGVCFEELLRGEVQIVAPTMLFRRRAYLAVDGFDESLRAEDHDFCARLAWHGFSFHYLPEPLVVKRKVEGNLGADIEGNYAAHVSALEKFRGRVSPVLYREAQVRLLLGKGRVAAGGNDLRLSFTAYRQACELAGSLVPLFDFGRYALRSMLLRSLPLPARAALRKIRSSVESG